MTVTDSLSTGGASSLRRSSGSSTLPSSRAHRIMHLRQTPSSAYGANVAGPGIKLSFPLVHSRGIFALCCGLEETGHEAI